MAQTKTARSTAKKNSRKSSSNGSRASGSSGRSKSSGSRAATSRKSSAKTAGRSRAAARKTANGGADAKSAVESVVKRAKGPAIAGGAALVGLAGGLALNNGKKRNGLIGKGRPKVSLNLPKPKGSTVKILGGAAKEIAKGGYKVGQLTSEVQKVRKAVETQGSGD
jgi:hypothetical protein